MAARAGPEQGKLPPLLNSLDGIAMTFAKLGLIEPLLRALERLDYNTPTPVQAQAIPAYWPAAT